jgi:hypothetical protein
MYTKVFSMPTRDNPESFAVIFGEQQTFLIKESTSEDQFRAHVPQFNPLPAFLPFYFKI